MTSLVVGWLVGWLVGRWLSRACTVAKLIFSYAVARGEVSRADGFTGRVVDCPPSTLLKLFHLCQFSSDFDETCPQFLLHMNAPSRCI